MSIDIIESPCIRVCTVDARTGWCLGCWRTLDEISHWTQYSAARRRELMDELAERERRALE